MRMEAYGRCCSALSSIKVGFARQRGLTLVELIITLSIVGLLTASVGSLGDWVHRSRVQTTFEHLQTTLAYARSESIKRGVVVVICLRASNAEACAGTDSEVNIPWNTGWLIYADLDGNKRFEPEEGDEALRLVEGINGDILLAWNRGYYIAYKPSGALSSKQGRFCLSRRDAADASSHYEIVIFRSGRARMTEQACSFALS